MLNMNFKTMMNCMMTNTSANYTLTNGTVETQSVGNFQNAMKKTPTFCDSAHVSGTWSTFMAFGTGNSAESKNSIKLDNEIQNLTFVSGSVGGVTSQSIYVFTTTVKNNTSSNITIKEVGLFFNISGASRNIMISRKVFVNPIELGVGKTATITLDLSDELSEEEKLADTLYVNTIALKAASTSDLLDKIMDMHSKLADNQKCMVTFTATANSYFVWGMRMNSTRGRYFFTNRTTNLTYSVRLTSESAVAYSQITMGSETNYTHS